MILSFLPATLSCNILVAYFDADSTKRLKRKRAERLSGFRMHPVKLDADVPWNQDLQGHFWLGNYGRQNGAGSDSCV
jgi:hypothetical protein